MLRMPTLLRRAASISPISSRPMSTGKNPVDETISGIAYHKGDISRGLLRSTIHVFFPSVGMVLTEDGLQPLSEPRNFVRYYPNESEEIILKTAQTKVEVSAIRINELISENNAFMNDPEIIALETGVPDITISIPVQVLKAKIKEWEQQNFEREQLLLSESRRLVESIGEVPTGLIFHPIV